MNTREVDIAIIGSGTAGLGAYREALKYTNNIALIEGGLLGTTCARVGCMPSKLLIAPAEARHRLALLPQFGISSDAGKVDGVAVMRRVRKERDRFVGFVTTFIDSIDPEHLVRAFAAFEDSHTLRLSAPSEGKPSSLERIRAKRIIIATGSSPAIPESLKPAGDRLIVSDDVFGWQDLPASVAVFGAGVIGLELSQALHRLGVRVRLFGRGGSIAGISDPVVREAAAGIIGREMSISLDAREVQIKRNRDVVEIRFTEPDGTSHQESYSYLLAATGRTANIGTLMLENSGLELDERGHPKFDPQTMRAGDSHIFIAGDANAKLPLLHEASDEGHLAGDNAGRYPEVYRRIRRTPLAIVFSDPQIAAVGQSHKQLIEAGVNFSTGEVSFENQGRARVMLVNQGLLRIYAEKTSGLLLGAEMIGPQNEHLAHLLAWAIQAKMTVAHALDMPFYHPVIEEGLRTALRNLLSALEMAPPPPSNCIDCGPGA